LDEQKLKHVGLAQQNGFAESKTFKEVETSPKPHPQPPVLCKIFLYFYVA
jgi:hypothetical protein